MAKKVQEFPAVAGRGGKFAGPPFWADGNIWLLTHGKDFRGIAKYHRQRINIQAKKLGIKVRTAIVGEDIYVQKLGVVPPSGAGVPQMAAPKKASDDPLSEII